MTGTIVVLGATGYTGRLAVEALLDRGTRPVIAGRRAGELSRLAADVGGREPLEWRVADVSDPASVRALVEAGDVLLTTVGPFERFGYAVAEAAAAGAHYVDSTGEVGFVREIRRRFDSVAREHGVTMLPVFGYDYVPGILAGALALADAPDATRVEIGYFATGPLWGGLSHGTRATMADGLLLPSTVWRDGRLTEVRTASAVAGFDVGGRHRTGFLVSGTEVLALPQLRPDLSDWPRALPSAPASAVPSTRSVSTRSGPVQRSSAWSGATSDRADLGESGRERTAAGVRHPASTHRRSTRAATGILQQ